MVFDEHLPCQSRGAVSCRRTLDLTQICYFITFILNIGIIFSLLLLLKQQHKFVVQISVPFYKFYFKTNILYKHLRAFELLASASLTVMCLRKTWSCCQHRKFATTFKFSLFAPLVSNSLVQVKIIFSIKCAYTLVCAIDWKYNRNFSVSGRSCWLAHRSDCGTSARHRIKSLIRKKSLKKSRLPLVFCVSVNSQSFRVLYKHQEWTMVQFEIA